MDKILKKYGDIIKGWDSDVGVGENPNDVYYWVWFKEPYVIKEYGAVSDTIDCELLPDLERKLKQVYKDQDVWNKWNNK